MHLDSAWAHRDLYYSNLGRSQEMPHECVTIMYDKIDHLKIVTPVFFHKTKTLDGLMRLLVSITSMRTHGHGDVWYAHYGLDMFAHDVNYTMGLFLKLLWDVEQPPKISLHQLFQGASKTSIYKAILQGFDACVCSLPPSS